MTRLEYQQAADTELSYALSAIRRKCADLAYADLTSALKYANKARNLRQAGKIMVAMAAVRRFVTA